MKTNIEIALSRAPTGWRRARALPREGLLGVIITLAFGLGLGYSMARGSDSAALAALAPAPDAPAISAPMRIEAMPAAPANSARDAPDSAALYRAMLGSTNLRAFVAEAKRHPEIGGYFYARQALRLCAFQNLPDGRSGADSRRYVHGENPAAYSQRMRAIEHFEQRCAGYGASDAATALETIDAEGARAGDVLLRGLADLARGAARWRDGGAGNAGTSRNGAAGGDATAWRAALTVLLAGADPLLWDADALLPLLAAPDGRLWLDGQSYAEGGGFELMQAALLLVGCRLGNPCDERDPMVENACLSGDECLGGREAAIAARVADGDAARMRSILALRDRLAQVISAGDAAAFLPPG